MFALAKRARSLQCVLQNGVKSTYNSRLRAEYPELLSAYRCLSTAATEETKAIFNRAREALEKSKAPAVKPVSNEHKLRLYALFKQAEAGPCQGSRPGMFDLVGRAKYDAWKSLGDMSAEQAMQEYVKGVKEIYGGELPPVESTQPSASGSSNAAPATATPPTASASTIKFRGFDDIFPRALSPEEVDTFSRALKHTQLSVDPATGIGKLTLNRPDKGNAFNLRMWDELKQSYETLRGDSRVKAVILTGNEASFSTGMDLSVFIEMQSKLSKIECEGRRREALHAVIGYLQDCVTAAEHVPVPVIAAISGNCIGGAIDLITATDLRYCTRSAKFCVKEIDLAIVADMGTVQRLPKVVNNPQWAAEVCYTARTFGADEALANGLVLKVFDTEAEMLKHVQSVAQQIAEKSPLTVRGFKKTLKYSAEHTVAEGLANTQLWNSAMLVSNDLLTAAQAVMTKQKPVFKDP